MMIHIKNDNNIYNVLIDPEHIVSKIMNDPIEVDLTQNKPTYKITTQATHNDITYEVIWNRCITNEDGSFDVLRDNSDNLYTMIEIGGDK